MATQNSLCLFTLKSPVPRLFSMLKPLHFSFSPIWDGSCCRLAMKLQDTWVTISICVLWHGNNQVPVTCLCPALQSRSLGVFPRPHNIAWWSTGLCLSSSSPATLPEFDLI